MKKRILITFALLFALSLASGCSAFAPAKKTQPATPPAELNQNALDNPGAAGYARDISAVDFSGVPFKPWDVEKAAAGLKQREKKSYTVLIYMNGSDLESESGAATKDLIEMLESGLKSDAANLVIFTGGTNRWRNNAVPSNTCSLFEIADGRLHKIADTGLFNIGNAGTLAAFIDFGVKNFPADKYGLIFWDHGGGSIAGFGLDEKFDDGNLTLLEMNYAFEKSAVKQTKFEFIGFDACLMASVETAVVAAPYAKYFIAAQDLEPGDGWNYRFLAALNNNPDGAALGKTVVDTFMDFYGADYDDGLSLSVINLQSVGAVMGRMGGLMRMGSDKLAAQKTASFNTLSKKRSNTKTFGIGSPRDNESDMVDIGDMAEKLKDLFPAECTKVLNALNKCVVYNRHNSNINLCGLSAFYIYGGKRTADKSLTVYSALQMESGYTGYLHDFYGYLKKQTALPFFKNGEKETRINGVRATMYKVNEGEGYETFAVPVRMNGEKADIIISVSPKSPEGRILGARKEEGFIVQKGYDEIGEGDKIEFEFSGAEAA